MIRKYLIIVVFLNFAQISIAGHIPLEFAERVARNFYYERVNQLEQVDYDDVRISSSAVFHDNKDPLYYIFNISRGGFVIVAAEEASFPVLGYAFTGSYMPDKLPPNVKGWMQFYQDQLSYIIKENIAPEVKNISLWEHLKADQADQLNIFNGKNVTPLLSSTWDQGKYYNEMCPADPAGPSGHCVTGCVATAMGQVLNYFRWPVTGTGYYSYSCPPYGTLSADFGNSDYIWDLMSPYLINSQLEAAEILYHLGVSVDMVYGPDGSGMYNHKAAYSMRTYFKYMPETEYVYRDSTNLDWDSLLVSHLDRNIPMYYAGWSVPNISGHAFVCDGYQEAGFYHFNWGWSGSYDGYFYTDNLNPGGSNFNLAQEVIINAIPDTITYNYPFYCGDTAIFTVTDGTIEDGSGPLFDYIEDAFCSWLIAPDDSVNSITLTFHSFETDTNDILTLYDGDDTGAPVLAVFSGNELPEEVNSSGSRMFITFSTDSAGTAPGWLVSFTSELPVYCENMSTLTGLSDTLTDGSGPYNYHNNTACLWMIQPPDAASVTLYFLDFETEDTVDFLQVYDLETQELLAEYSGTYAPGLPEPVTSPSGKMFIAFSTNWTFRYQGWTAYYETSLVGIDEHYNANLISVYPNPASEKLIIEGTAEKEGQLRLILLDLTGRPVLINDLSIAAGRFRIRTYLAGIPGGIYFLNLSGNQINETRKIIILDD